ncbi:hypothetical protein AB0A63_01595 [Lentzea sp. NPDC042327]|uniref:hypothetical protein n=1 Tax=Lentzea sp. NPDC042327 TaxID=3154801 RepID=UPI0033F6758D
MTGPDRDEETVQRGAAEEASGTPLTETEAEVSRRPPSDTPEDVPDEDGRGTGGMGLGGDDVE